MVEALFYIEEYLLESRFLKVRALIGIGNSPSLSIGGPFYKDEVLFCRKRNLVLQRGRSFLN